VCRVATATLEPQHEASAIARRFLTPTLASWDVLTDSVDLALLLASEAVTNAVVHARSASTLTVALAGGCLEIGVRDHSHDRPRPPHPLQDAVGQRPAETVDPMAESGRGLLLIAALADTWGVQDLDDGKQVWFRFPAQRAAGASSLCDCEEDSVHGIVLGSGARAVHTDI